MTGVLLGVGAFWLLCSIGVVWLVRQAGKADEND